MSQSLSIFQMFSWINASVG